MTVNPLAAQKNSKPAAVCICIHCMDRRINSNATHGVEVFKMSTAGASFPAPSAQQCTQEDSLHIILERAKESGQTVISAFSGHEDCVAVQSIWNAAHKPATERSERDAARLAPYAALVEQVRSHTIEETERLRLLTQAKTLQDINHAFAYDDIQAVVNENELSIVAYFEDVVTEPHRLYIFDVKQNVFVSTTTRLKELLEQPELLEQYALKAPVNVAAFVEDKAAIYKQRRYEKAIKSMVVDRDEQDAQEIRPALQIARVARS
ncbi:MAG: hypothetical protein SFW65_05905 [Alphaproteobacteria bacterium]|nr:hypothetical protein [Alphaproteobacteria bacterium]